MKTKIIVILGHGSRDKKSNALFESLVYKLRQRVRPNVLMHAYLQKAKPDAYTVLKELASKFEEIVILPLLLFDADHSKKDIPECCEKVRLENPRVNFEIMNVMGVDPIMTDVVLSRVRENEGFMDRNLDTSTLIIVGRGSSDAKAQKDFLELVQNTKAFQREGAKTEPCFISVCKPSLKACLEQQIEEGAKSIFVSPYILFGGKLLDKIKSKIEEVQKEHSSCDIQLCPILGDHEHLITLLVKRIRSTLSSLTMSHGSLDHNSNSGFGY